MENVEFTDEEIREQLANLGYFDVSETRLKQFRKDLQRLVEHDRSSGSSSWFTGITSPSATSDSSPGQQRQPSPQLKPSLSRYQPHIRVSPRQPDPELYGETSTRASRTSRESSPLAGTRASPETRLKNLKLSDDSPLNSSDESSSPHGAKGYTETLIPRRDRTSDVPSTSHAQNDDDDNVTDDPIDHHGNTDRFSPSYQSFMTTDDVTPETPSMRPPPYAPTSSERRIITKEKLYRKPNGESSFFDESLVTDSSYQPLELSVDDMNINYDRLRLPSATVPPRPHTARPSTKRSPDQVSVHDQPLPSYIRPNTSHPHTRNIRKTDPVNRYHQYRDAWKSIKAPGEKSHSQLRWEVKAQMMYKDEPQPKPQRIYVPNTYVVPTSKKRSALRWEVRHALERGTAVPSTFTVV